MALIDSVWRELALQGKAQRPNFHLNPYMGQRQDETGNRAVLVSCAPESEHTRRQAAVLLSLTHPNIVRVLDTCELEHEGTRYLVLVQEYQGKTLEMECLYRMRGQYFLRQDLMRLAQGLVDALAYLQEQGIAHRSITPDNIFVERAVSGIEGEINLKIGNFWWLQEDVRDETMQDMNPVGASIFSSPAIMDAFRQRSFYVSHNVYKSDVYSLGMVLHYLSDLRFQPSDPTFSEMIQAMTYPLEDYRLSFTQLRDRYFPSTHISPLMSATVSENDTIIATRGSFKMSITNEASSISVPQPSELVEEEQSLRYSVASERLKDSVVDEKAVKDSVVESTQDKPTMADSASRLCRLPSILSERDEKKHWFKRIETWCTRLFCFRQHAL